MEQSNYDVAIVGAGPAGSVAAKVIAEAGLSVLLVDRRMEFGSPVQCGEFLPTSGEMRGIFPSSKRVGKLVDVPKRFIVNTTDDLHLYSPGGRVFPFPLSANVLDRSEYDRYLTESAQSAGADISAGIRLLRTEQKTTLVLKQGSRIFEVRARVVVGADGARSRVAQGLGPAFQHREADLCQSVQFVLHGGKFDPRVTEMHFGSRIAPGGYFWIIPRSESEANVGLGIRWAFAESRLSVSQYLLRLIRSHPHIAPMCKGAETVRRIGGVIPMGGPLPRTYSNGTVLIGDAAGHVMASNGGGISTALAGGEIAGEVVTAHLQDAVPLSDYEIIWRQEFENELQSALNILRIADKVMISDSLTDLCMSLAGPRFLKHIIRCRLPTLVDLASKTLVKALQHIL